MNKEQFRDKVYACWMGKNIGGTLGGPLEGIMELLDIKNYTQEFVQAVENDDLDLQLVALHCVEQYAGLVTTDRLAQEWVSHVHFQFDEYGHALTNMRQGLRHPLAGAYNNYFTDCMGSPIRSELWGILCAGMPDMAAYYAYQDASVDHAGGEGVYGEIFFAVFESLAFTNTDILELIEQGLSYLPKDCATYGAVRCLLECKSNGLDWIQAREVLICQYGTENFTYAPINVAFTLMGLLYGTGFTQQLLISTNCGYDTDCTCATVGAMMGILYGTAYIDEMWTKPLGENIIVSTPVNGFHAPKTISELTERTLLAHDMVSAIYAAAPDKSVFKSSGTVCRERTLLPQGSGLVWDYLCETRYQDDTPAIAPNAEKQVTLHLENHLPVAVTLQLNARVCGCGIQAKTKLVTLAAGEAAEYSVLVQRQENRAKYPGEFCITRMENGSPWASYQVPLTLLPTQDWQISVDGGVPVTCCCETARLPVETLSLQNAQLLKASTTIYVDREKELRLIANCRQPLELQVDGAVVADCREETPEIPAYHRAESRKAASLQLTSGAHTVEIQVSKAADIKNIFFYAVDPGFYCAAQTDILIGGAAVDMP